MGKKKSDGKQIASLLKKRTMEESEALYEHARIRGVLSGRHLELEQFLLSLVSIKKEQAHLRSTTRPNLLLKGEFYSLAGLLKYDRNLEQRISLLEKKVREKEEEISMAENRAVVAQDDVIGARIEKKRVERLLSRKLNEQLRADDAIEEQEFDDLLGVKKK